MTKGEPERKMNFTSMRLLYIEKKTIWFIKFKSRYMFSFCNLNLVQVLL